MQVEDIDLRSIRANESAIYNWENAEQCAVAKWNPSDSLQS